MKILRILLVIVLIVGAGRAFNAGAQTVTILHSFGGYPTDGVYPQAGLVQGSDGNFYGTTEGGGTNNNGTVFRISPSGNLSNLWSFTGGTDGANPRAGLVQGSDGNFYGTTRYGGAYGGGTVFRISPSGGYTILYSFGGYSNDGDEPLAGLVQGSDGNFYGTTDDGGAPGLGLWPYAGTVFRISPSGTEAILHSFGGDINDGIWPFAGLVQGSDGNFYGTTTGGGAVSAGSCGSVFGISPSGSETILYSFHCSPSDGWYPIAGLVRGSDGNFYGTTPLGGSGCADCGTVFRISPSGCYMSLYSFVGSPADGAEPFAGLVQGSDGNFYGTTVSGGMNTNCQVTYAVGCGTVFRISPSGTETTLYSFGSFPTDGANPEGTLVQGSDGNFYGTTLYGGTYGYGTVFKLTIPLPAANSWTYTPGGKWETGANWSLGLAPSTSDGLDLITNANSKTVTIDATTSGSFPFTMTISNLIVSAPLGSTNTLCLNNAGLGTPLDILNGVTITANGMVLVTNSMVRVDSLSGGSFSIDGGVVVSGNGFVIATNNSTTVGDYGIGQMTVSNGTVLAQAVYVGFNPGSQGTLTLAGGTLSLSSLALTLPGSYVVFSSGWLNTAATISSNGQPFVVGDGVDAATLQLQGGVHSFSNVLRIRNNATLSGCAMIDGTVQVDAGGTVVAGCGGTLSFSGIVTNNGSIIATNGTTIDFIGPVVGTGTVVYTDGKIQFLAAISTSNSPANGGSTSGAGAYLVGSNVTVCATANAWCYSFVNWTVNGSEVSTSPCCSFTAVSNETLVANFAVNTGGPASGSLTSLWSFTGGMDGAYPQAGLVQGSDGNFYGTAYGGGTSGNGTVFRISPSGNLSNLWSFTGGTDGAYPQAGLVQGSDGNFYGTASQGGTSGNGTVFRISPSGSLTTLWGFITGCSDGGEPYAGLVQGSDGNFYGTASQGGTSGNGTVFRITPGGSLTILWLFTDGSDGAYPYAPLVQGSDGNFYGTAYGGGTSGNGTVFRLSVPLNPPANQISGIKLMGSSIVVTIPSVAGETYQLQYSNSLTLSNWSNVGSASMTNSIGGLLSLTNLGGAMQPQRFYRFAITP